MQEDNKSWQILGSIQLQNGQSDKLQCFLLAEDKTMAAASVTEKVCYVLPGLRLLLVQLK